jgi:hypothetical protein
MEVGKRGRARGDDRKLSAVGDGKGKKRAREGRPQKLPILLGFARTRQGPRGQVGPVGTMLDGLFLWAFMASHKAGPTFIFSIPESAGAEHCVALLVLPK